MKRKKTLFILGNGFDLSLGMNSTFKNFGIYRRKQLMQIPMSEWTLIDLLLESDTNGYWGKDNSYYDFAWYNFEEYLKNSILNAICNNDFLNILGNRISEAKQKSKINQNEKIQQKRQIVSTLSRDGFLMRNKEYPEATGFIINNKKVESISAINLDHQSIGYYLQLLFLKRIDKFHSHVANVLFSDDISTYQTEKITESNITSDENIIQIPSLFVNFSVVKPLLIKDLNAWETAFAKFIKTRQDATNIEGLDYEDVSSKFINSVLLDKNQAQDVQILNFNYSKPKTTDYKDNGQTLLHHDKQLNIHGSIDAWKKVNGEVSGIIIGYDYQALIDYPEFVDELAPFTKTFRVSELNTILAKQSNYYHNTKFDYTVDRIVILGHSLSKADDSYFRTIFDTADLYSGDVILEYWYTDYPGRDQSISVETENLQKVNGLLMRYIQTSKQVNKDNLLHKLLLENRLLLREYNQPWIKID